MSCELGTYKEKEVYDKENDYDGDQIMEESCCVSFPIDEIIVEDYSKRRISSRKGHPSKRGRRSWLNSQSSLKPEKLNWEEEAHLVDSPYFEGTTLFKHVRYEDIEIDDEVKADIKTLEENSDAYKNMFYGNGFHDHVKIAGFNSGHWAIRTYHVLQVICITVYNKDDPSFKVYGEISVTDYKKNTFFIWKRKPDDPDCVSSKRNYLSLNDCPTPPVLGGKVRFRLTNDNDVEMFNKDYDLDDSTEDVCDEEIMNQKVSRVFQGEDGYCARMVFARIPVAALVRVRVSVNYKPPNREVGTDCKVRGTITVNNVVCWKSSVFEDTWYGEYVGFELSRRAIVVPLFSPLAMEFSLEFGDGGSVNMTRKISPLFWISITERSTEIPCESEHCNFGIHLQCLPHEYYFDETQRLSSYLDVEWGSDITPKIDQPLTEVKSDQALVEIFSVYFGGGSVSVPLCGTIVVLDRDGRVYIFSRNKRRPDKMSWSNRQQRFIKTVSLAWPDRWIRLKDFYMHLNLKDVENHQVCRGFLRFLTNSKVCNEDEYIRYDMRACDVIQGENDFFAAVHYSIFINGKKVRVSVKCSKEGGLNNDLLVYGSVFAAYGNYDYPSTYDKECYRVIIFKRSKEDYVRLKSSSEIPLSKSHISAPSDCEKLIIDADLWVSSYMTSYQLVTANFEFESSRNGCQSAGCIKVDVDWIQ